MSDLEKDLKEKEELVSLYSKEDKINTNILKKYKSYLDWIELVYLKKYFWERKQNYVIIRSRKFIRNYSDNAD